MPERPRYQCNIRAVPAVACTTPKAAAYMWRQVRNDWRIVNDSNNRQLLQESMCSVFRLPELRNLPLVRVGSERVATSLGWVDVVAVNLEGYPMLHIAAGYLGPCKRATSQSASIASTSSRSE